MEHYWRKKQYHHLAIHLMTMLHFLASNWDHFLPRTIRPMFGYDDPSTSHPFGSATCPSGHSVGLLVAKMPLWPPSKCFSYHTVDPVVSPCSPMVTQVPFLLPKCPSGWFKCSSAQPKCPLVYHRWPSCSSACPYFSLVKLHAPQVSSAVTLAQISLLYHKNASCPYRGAKGKIYYEHPINGTLTTTSTPFTVTPHPPLRGYTKPMSRESTAFISSSFLWRMSTLGGLCHCDM